MKSQLMQEVESVLKEVAGYRLTYHPGSKSTHLYGNLSLKGRGISRGSSMSYVNRRLENPDYWMKRQELNGDTIGERTSLKSFERLQINMPVYLECLGMPEDERKRVLRTLEQIPGIKFESAMEKK